MYRYMYGNFNIEGFLTTSLGFRVGFVILAHKIIHCTEAFLGHIGLHGIC
jgi:hypothetical protein